MTGPFAVPDWVIYAHSSRAVAVMSERDSDVSGIRLTRYSMPAGTYKIALAAIAISLVLQSRSLGLTRMEIMRSHQHDLIKFTIEHPILLSGWGYRPPTDSSLEDAQVIGFVSMLIGFWRTSYEGRMIRDEELRQNLAHVFDGEAGRKFWADSRDSYLKSVDGGRSRRFVGIIDEEFQKAKEEGPPLVGSAFWSEPSHDESVTATRPESHQPGPAAQIPHEQVPSDRRETRTRPDGRPSAGARVAPI